jgi:serine phosphatase RsbU (regulator of sigma subunit)
LTEMKVEGIFEELKEFTTGVRPDDDATLVVMRVTDEHTEGTC